MILPYNVDRPARLTPTVTYALMAANILVYVLTTGYTNYKMYTERPAPDTTSEEVGGLRGPGADGPGADGPGADGPGASSSTDRGSLGGRAAAGSAAAGSAAAGNAAAERVGSGHARSGRTLVAGYGYSRTQRAGMGDAGVGQRLAQATSPEEGSPPSGAPVGAPVGGSPRDGMQGLGDGEAGGTREIAMAEMEQLSKTPEGRSLLWAAQREAWNQEHAHDALALDTHPDVLSWLAYLTVAPSLLTAFTSMFLHGGLDHLLGNMLFLWVFGRAVEDTLGRGIYLAAYLLCGVAAVMLYHVISVATQPPIMMPFMGASGAIMGVTGLFAPRFYRTPVRLFYTNFNGARIFYLGTIVLGLILSNALGLGAAGFTFASLIVLGAIVMLGDEMLWGELKWPAAWVIGLGLLIQDVGPALFDMASGYVGGGTAHWAHIGGFLCGATYAFLIGSHKEGKSEYLVDEARQSLDFKHGNNAIEAAQQVVMMKPDDPVGYQLLAEAHDAKGKPEQALENYKLALDKYLRRGERSVAAKLYAEAALRHSDWVPEAPTLFLLASQMAKDSDWKGAAESLAKLPYYYPEASEGEMAFLRAAQIYHERLDQPVVAMQLLHEFGNRFPESPWMEKATALYQAASASHAGQPPAQEPAQEPAQAQQGAPAGKR